MASAKKKILRSGVTRWYASYLGGDGKYHMQGGYATQREATRVAHALEEEARRGHWVDPRSARMTFARYVEEFYWPTAKHLEVSTRAAYRSYLDKHFLPTFGTIPMRRITSQTIQGWVNAASPALSARSVVKYHALLHRIFARAVIDQVVPTNPCTNAALPKVVRRMRRIITPREFGAVISAIDPRYQTMVLLEIETGLRWGELVALRPCDIDFAARVVHVHRTLVEVAKRDSPTGERISIKAYPKDDEPRDVQIEGATCALIRTHMIAHGVRDDALLFTSKRGTPMSRPNFRQRVWLPALESAGVQNDVTFHGLRAAHASWLLAGGADLQVVKERLGHRQISTTQQYLGTLPDAGDRALAALRKTRDVG